MSRSQQINLFDSISESKCETFIRLVCIANDFEMLVEYTSVYQRPVPEVYERSDLDLQRYTLGFLHRIIERSRRPSDPEEGAHRFGSPGNVKEFPHKSTMSCVLLISKSICSSHRQGVQKVFPIGKCEHEKRKVRMQSFTIHDSLHLYLWRSTDIARSTVQEHF
jgi:hypothetical protein